MQNEQFKKITGKTLFEYYLFSCVNNVKRFFYIDSSLGSKDDGEMFLVNFFDAIFILIVEIGNIDDIRKTSPMDALLELAENDFFFATLLNIPKDNFSAEEVYDLQKRRYEIDDLLANIIAYWSTEDKNYELFKKKLILLSPFFPMAFDVIEGREKEFAENFHDKLVKLEDCFIERYHVNDKMIGLYTTSFLFVLLVTAIKHNRLAVIDKILKNDNFSTIVISFPSNMARNETCHYVAVKMLENGTELHEVPADWISPVAFKKFLDSRITYNGETLIEIDCGFLQETGNRKFKIKGKQDITDEVIFNDATDALQYIINSESLQTLITHPVLSTYINLKSLKYRSIYLWNFWIFFVLFILPFGSLVSLHFLSDQQNMIFHWLYFGVKVFCPFSVLFLVIREAFQFYSVEGSFKTYFKKMSNWVESALILFSTLTLVVCWVDDNPFITKYLEPYVPVIMIALMTVDFMSMLPFASMPLHMMMLKKVSLTFLKFFITFIFILIAFSICFCVVFGVRKGNLPDFETWSINESDNKTTVEISKEISSNFLTFPTAFLKVILMLSGEYSVEPSALSHSYQMIFFFFFVLSTFILFNLILGLTIDDVQKLRDDARYLMLKSNAGKFIKTNQKCKEMYKSAKYVFNLYKNLDQNDKVFLSIFPCQINEGQSIFRCIEEIFCWSSEVAYLRVALSS